MTLVVSNKAFVKILTRFYEAGCLQRFLGTSKMADSSDSDSEEDSKLKEALDTSTLTDNLYRRPETSINGVTTCNGIGGQNSELSENGGKRFLKPESKAESLKKGVSLRRDKQLDEEVVSDIQVDFIFWSTLTSFVNRR